MLPLRPRRCRPMLPSLLCALAACLGSPGLARAATWQVPSLAPSIQSGLDMAVAGDTVLVACGTYYEHDIIMKSGVVLRSATGLPDCVTVDAGRQDRVFYCVALDSSTRIEGLTITGGSPKSNPAIGGGIYCLYSDPFLTDCVISGNVADADGGGIYCDQSSPTLSGCSLDSNTTYLEGGGMYLVDSSPTLQDCQFNGNDASGWGGGIKCTDGSNPHLVACRFADNNAYGGGGFACFYGAAPLLDGCLFVDNTGQSGGGADCWWTSSPTFESCTFIGNAVESSGGGLRCFDGANAQIIGCTIYGNSAEYGAGLASYNCTPVVASTIIAFNLGSAVYCWGDAGDAVLSCCDVFGNSGANWGGCIGGQDGINGNFSVDPLFCAPEAGDLTLDAASPCLAAPGCGRVGAHGQGCPVVNVPALDIAQDLILYQNQPNPFNPCTTIRFAIPDNRRVRLRVFGVDGRMVASLLDDFVAAGYHDVCWPGKDIHGRPVSSGIYFYRLEAGGSVGTKRMVLVK
jgi:hypothetical protein